MYLNPSTSRFFDLKAGDTLIRGFLETGDHLFVNRLSLAFKEPKRGDVMVFTTDDLDDPDGTGFGGRYYVKRLVGLPGDTLKIVDRKLYVKPQGEADFRLLDANDAKGFERIYSETGAYHGYAHMPEPALHLTSNSAEMQIPDGHYVMLGDNSENSKDSRYWTAIPSELVTTILTTAMVASISTLVIRSNFHRHGIQDEKRRGNHPCVMIQTIEDHHPAYHEEHHRQHFHRLGSADVCHVVRALFPSIRPPFKRRRAIASRPFPPVDDSGHATLHPPAFHSRRNGSHLREDVIRQ